MSSFFKIANDARVWWSNYTGNLNCGCTISLQMYVFLGFNLHELVAPDVQCMLDKRMSNERRVAPSCVWKSASRIIRRANVHCVYWKIFRTVKYNLIYQAISGSPRFIEIVRRRDDPRNWRPCARCYNVGIHIFLETLLI